MHALHFARANMAAPSRSLSHRIQAADLQGRPNLPRGQHHVPPAASDGRRYSQVMPHRGSILLKLAMPQSFTGTVQGLRF